MDDHFSRQLKKGILELVVLQLICAKPSYGYELLTRLAQDSNGLFTLKEGTLYPILYRLEDEGFIASAWGSCEGTGRAMPKKTYTATPAGHIALTKRLQIWHELVTCVNALSSQLTVVSPKVCEEETK